MSFLTSLFLVVFLIVGPCLPQDFDPFVLLRITMEAIGEKQDLILQRLDEQKIQMETLQTMMQDIQTNVTKLQESHKPLEESIRLQNTQIDAFKNTFLSEQGEMRNSLLQCSTTQAQNSFQDRITQSLNPLEESIRRIDNATEEMPKKILQFQQCQRGSCGSTCKEVLENGGVESGVYTITPKGFSEGVKVYCDQVTDGGGWTTILERRRPAQVNFTRSFEEYAAGFGDPNGELYIGNRVLHSMTGEDPFTLRVEATGVEGQYYYYARDGGSSEDYGGSRYGIWETFSVGGEDTQFRLSVGGYSDSRSTLGDAITGWQDSSNNLQFSTYDRDNDRRSGGHCSILYGRGGWWYDSCHDTNPTAPLGDTFDWTKATWEFWNKGSSSRSNQLLAEISFKIRK